MQFFINITLSMKRYFLLFSVMLWIIIPASHAQNNTSQNTDSTIQSGKTQSEEARKAIEDYLLLMEDYLKYQEMDKLEEYATKYIESIGTIILEKTKYESELTPEQIAKMQELSTKISEKYESESPFSPRESSSDLEDHLEPSENASKSTEELDNYLDCLENVIKYRLLPENSLFYLNENYIQIIRETCAEELSAYTYYTLERKLDKTRNSRLEELLSLCKSRVKELIVEKGFDTSPDAAIREMSNHIDMISLGASTKEMRTHDGYLEFLIDVLMKGGKMNKNQKNEILNVFIKYINKRDGIKKKEDGEIKMVYFETLDELIRISEIFYEEKLENIQSIEELSENDKSYFVELKYYLKEFSNGDMHSDLEIDQSIKEKLDDLLEKYLKTDE